MPTRQDWSFAQPMMDWQMIALVTTAYLLGGIPTGYLIARKAKGIDIRRHGSGNPGAANVYRIVGPLAGWATLAGDAFKGYIPVMAARNLYPSSPELWIGIGAAAILGHIWTVYLGFRGGKGVATSCGVFAALLPIPTLIAFLIFIAAVGVSGHISVGSILASAAMPALAWMVGAPKAMQGMAAIVAGVILLRHASNIRRLLGRKELTLGGRKGNGKKEKVRF